MSTCCCFFLFLLKCVLKVSVDFSRTDSLQAVLPEEELASCRNPQELTQCLWQSWSTASTARTEYQPWAPWCPDRGLVLLQPWVPATGLLSHALAGLALLSITCGNPGLSPTKNTELRFCHILLLSHPSMIVPGRDQLFRNQHLQSTPVWESAFRWCLMSDLARPLCAALGEKGHRALDTGPCTRSLAPPCEHPVGQLHVLLGHCLYLHSRRYAFISLWNILNIHLYVCYAVS